MFSNRIPVGQLVFNLGLVTLLVLALGSGRASTLVSAEPQTLPAQAVPGGPGYLMVPASAFQPEYPTDPYVVFWGELSIPSTSPNLYTHFNAPLYLPQGAQLTGMTLYYRNTTTGTNMVGVDLIRKPLPGPSSGEGVLAVYSTLSGYGIYESDTTPVPTRAVIDNSQYAYYLSYFAQKAPSGDYVQLQAIRVDWGYNVALPTTPRYTPR